LSDDLPGRFAKARLNEAAEPRRVQQRAGYGERAKRGCGGRRVLPRCQSAHAASGELGDHRCGAVRGRSGGEIDVHRPKSIVRLATSWSGPSRATHSGATRTDATVTTRSSTTLMTYPVWLATTPTAREAAGARPPGNHNECRRGRRRRRVPRASRATSRATVARWRERPSVAARSTRACACPIRASGTARYTAAAISAGAFTSSGLRMRARRASDGWEPGRSGHSLWNACIYLVLTYCADRPGSRRSHWDRRWLGVRMFSPQRRQSVVRWSESQRTARRRHCRWSG